MLNVIERTDRLAKLDELFEILSDWCAEAPKPIVLLIDEVDTASNNQVFSDFLAQLRDGYLDRADDTLFGSLMGKLTNIPGLKRQLRSVLMQGSVIAWKPFEVERAERTMENARN